MSPKALCYFQHYSSANASGMCLQDVLLVSGTSFNAFVNFFLCVCSVCLCVCAYTCQCRCSLACWNCMECADKGGLDTNKPRLRILSVHMMVFHLSSAYRFQKSTHLTSPFLINQQGCHFCSRRLCDLVLHPSNQPFIWHILGQRSHWYQRVVNADLSKQIWT